MDLTPKQQASEAIRQAETILILTGAHPSVDQAAAVVGLSMILRKFGKRVSAVMSDGLPAAVAALDGAVVDRQMGGVRDFILKLDTTKARVDTLRYEPVDDKLFIFVTPQVGSFAPSDVTFDYGQPSFVYDLAIVLGVPTRARIDRVYEQNLDLFGRIPMVNLDFHRSNEQYGAVNLIDGNASSLCEMLVATSESLQAGLVDAEIGTIFLMGIMAATDRFTAAHTTSKSLTVAAQMMAAGGQQPAVVKALYRDGRPSGERSGGGDRKQQPRPAAAPRTETPRAEARPEPQRAPQPAVAPPAAPTVSEPIQPPEQVQASVEAQPSPEWREAPIIEPAHIEVSEPAQPQQTQPVMADFAAAAELLAQRQAEEPIAAPAPQVGAQSDQNPTP